MDFISKLFSPLKGQEKNRKYQDLSKESQKVDARPPSKLLLYARDIAGMQIQKQMAALNDCRWIRSEYTYPAFDEMSFIYKNKVFSVVIDIQDDENFSYLPEEYKKRQLYSCKENNLIPCKFPVVLPNPNKPDFDKICSKTNGWNLFNTETDEEIIPEQIATDEKIKMSEWEMRNFAIKFVLKYLSSQNYKVYSYQDTLEVDPQIWFEDNSGNKCWLIVRSALAPAKKAEKPLKLKEITRRCFKNDGYFAGMIFTPQNENKKDTNLYRLGNVQIEFSGLEKIHTVL